ncbi:hypothetical protein FJD35_18490 [Pseudomonas mandelii]|nr:hypothetical protein FJD35_18490 [Pseudomonas mandelii]
MGASLLAIAVGQSILMSNDPPLSRAGSLPQVFARGKAKSIRRVLFTIVHCQRLDCSIVQSPLFISVQQRTLICHHFKHFQSRSIGCIFWHETRSTAWVA